jgi:DNA-directed RNA polymerase-4/5 subunit 2
MVKSDLCWMKEADKGDCDFDREGYFLVKGEEKVSLNNSFLFLPILALYVWLQLN